jgi:hypothetical protein
MLAGGTDCRARTIKVNPMLWKSTRATNKIRVVILVVFCAAFGLGPIWLAHRRDETRELHNLYLYAAAGDVNSVHRISSYHSAESVRVLEQLARDKSARAETRVDALNELSRKSSADPDVFTNLLWIDHPFVVRHAAASALMDRRCDSTCITAVLYCLHSLWAGELTFEARLGSGRHANVNQVQATLARLRSSTENDYFGLLNKNSCSAEKVLHSDYSDAAFTDYVRQKLVRCN